MLPPVPLFRSEGSCLRLPVRACWGLLEMRRWNLWLTFRIHQNRPKTQCSEMTSEMFLWHSLDHKPQHTSTSTCRGNMLCHCDKPSESHEQQAVSHVSRCSRPVKLFQDQRHPTASSAKIWKSERTCGQWEIAWGFNWKIWENHPQISINGGFSIAMVLLPTHFTSLRLPGFTGWGDNLCSQWGLRSCTCGTRRSQSQLRWTSICYDQLDEGWRCWRL